MKRDADGHYEGCPRVGGCTCSVVDAYATSVTEPRTYDVAPGKLEELRPLIQEAVKAASERGNVVRLEDIRPTPETLEMWKRAERTQSIAGTPATMLGEAVAHVERAVMLATRAQMDLLCNISKPIWTLAAAKHELEAAKREAEARENSK